MLHRVTDQDAQTVVRASAHKPLEAHLLKAPPARQIQPATDFQTAPQTGEQGFKPWASKGHYRLKPQEDHIQSTPFWLGLPVILTLGRLRQEDCRLETSIGYMARYCLKRGSPKHLPLLIYLLTVFTSGMSASANLPPPSASTTTTTLFSPFSFSFFKPPDSVLKDVYYHWALCFPP